MSAGWRRGCQIGVPTAAHPPIIRRPSGGWFDRLTWGRLQEGHVAAERSIFRVFRLAIVVRSRWASAAPFGPGIEARRLLPTHKWDEILY